MPDPSASAVSGWLVLDKPRGLGSTQAVAAVKRVLREAGYGKVKVGHGGTLDPLAEGVLPVALGEATKLAGRMLDASKVYEFTIAFGEETDTLDAEGSVVATSAHRPLAADVAAVLPRFTGAIDQVPPVYSALKVEGQRAYDRVRAGEAVELAVRRVTIHSLSVRPGPVEGPHFLPGMVRAEQDDGSTGPARTELEGVTLVAHVSKGTYIRSLARDVARALGTAGHVNYLRRTRAGPFREQGAISLDLLNEIGKGARLQDHLLPLEAGLDGIPALDLDWTSAQAAQQGRVLSDQALPDGLFLARYAGLPVALMEAGGGTASVVRGFNFILDTAKDVQT